MIVHRNDQHFSNNQGYGVGYQILNASSFDLNEVNFALSVLQQKILLAGEGVVAIDCGANIGVHTIEWARFMNAHGEVIAFEPQEKIYYALCGNIAINNCFNVTAKHAAVGKHAGELAIPKLDYTTPYSFGSLELNRSQKNEFIGQEVNYDLTESVPLVSIDSLKLNRLDFIKIDVEGMEEDVLEGAKISIEKFKPAMIIEVIKSNKNNLEKFLRDRGYEVYPVGINILAIHPEDPIHKRLKIENKTLMFV
jgi:FkbM family methyltransferase